MSLETKSLPTLAFLILIAVRDVTRFIGFVYGFLRFIATVSSLILIARTLLLLLLLYLDRIRYPCNWLGFRRGFSLTLMDLRCWALHNQSIRKKNSIYIGPLSNSNNGYIKNVFMQFSRSCSVSVQWCRLIPYYRICRTICRENA